MEETTEYWDKAPFSTAQSAKLEEESEEEVISDGSWFGDRSNGEKRRKNPSSTPASTEKRRPGRPRKPDHELRRPRRSRDRKGESARKKMKLAHTVETGYAPVAMKQSYTMVAPRGRSMEDQALITAQQQQIEKMDRQLRQYEAHINAISTQPQVNRLDSAPPTPATSINHSSLYTHTQPSNSNVPSHQAGYSTNENESGLTNGEREDSPVSVYSDLNLSEIFDDNDGEWNAQDKEGRTSSEYGTRGNDRELMSKPSLIITLKGNFETVWWKEWLEKKSDA